VERKGKQGTTIKKHKREKIIKKLKDKKGEKGEKTNIKRQ
jgi:hypothetical protein